MSEVVVGLPWAQNELLRQLETRHHPKHPDELNKTKQLIGHFSKNQITWLMESEGSEALTRTIPATNAPQLNVPMSFGIEMNL